MKRKLLLMITFLIGEIFSFAQVIDESFEAWPPTNWTLDPSTGDGTWVQDDGSSHGPGATNIYDGFFAAMFNNYDYSSGTTGSMITPVFDVTSKINPTLSFYWWNNDGSATPATLDVYSTSDGTTWDLIESINTYGSGATTWVQFSHIIANNVIQIKLTATSNWGMKNTFVDKFVIEGDSCPAPTNQTETNITTTSVDLGWTSGGSSTWNIEYGPTGYTQGSGTKITGVTTDPYNLSGLSSATTYDWYVQDDCGGGQSSWVGPSTFTLCTATAAPLAENFDGVTTPDLPACWSKIVDATSTYAYVKTINSSSAHSAPNYSALYNHSDAAATIMLIAPGFSDLTSQANQIRFWSKSSSTGYTLIIGTITDPGDKTTFSGFDTISLTSTFTEYTVVFGNNYVGTDSYIAFKHGLGGTDRTIYIDDFNYEPIPSCPAPADQTEDSLKLNSVQLSWTENGSATEWNVRLGVAGFDTTGTAFSTVTNDTITVDTLLASTAYDWYVRASCGGGDYSSWIGPHSFTTDNGIAIGPDPADGTTDLLVDDDTLRWNPVANATKYVINIGTTSGGNDVLADYSNADTIYIKGSNWDYSTQYYWTVSTVYNGTNDTVFGNEWDFTTECETVSVFPYAEGFEDAVPPDCWSEEIVNDPGTDPDWSYVSSGSSPSCSPVAGSHMAKFNSHSASNGATARLIMPEFDFTGITGVAMSFWMYHENGYSSYTGEGIKVQISTDGTSWSDHGSLYPRISTSAGWSKHTVDLSSYDNQTLFIAFLGVSEYGYNIYIDSVTVHNNAPATATWTGSTDNNWYDVDNWNTTDIPYPTTTITIPTGLSNYPTISTTGGNCSSVTIKSDATGTASLLGQNYLSASGTSTVECYITKYTDNSDGWHFLSSPVNTQTIQPDFVTDPPSASDDFYYFDETVASLNWINSKTSSGIWNTGFDAAFVLGKGYLVAYSSNSTKSFSGTLNDNDVNVSLSFTSGAPWEGWNLLGNPFPSAIDWDNLTKSGSVDGTVYVLRASDNTYISWNGSAGDLTNGIIPTADGFFVHATATGQTIDMELADQTHATNNIFKSSQELAKNTLKVSVNDNEYNNSMYLQFRDDATPEFDNSIDGYKLFGFTNEPEIYSEHQSTLYTIDCLPDNPDGYDIPVGVKSEKEGRFYLSFNGIDNIKEKYSVVLEDLLTNTSVSLTEGYSYEFNRSSNDNELRFLLHFKSVTGIGEQVYNNELTAYALNKIVWIKSLNKKPLKGQFKLINMTGQVILEKSLNRSTVQQFNTNLNNGLYLINLQLENGIIYTTKVVIR